MTMTLQGSFTSGELSPSLTARLDLSKYGQGCKLLRNMLVQPHGGATKRPGFLLVDELPGEAAPVPFVFNVEQAYVLLFGEGWLRVATPDGPVLGADGAPYQMESPYSLADARELSFAQSADVLFLACRNVRPHKLKRYGHADWRFEAMDFAPPLAPPAWETQAATTTQTTYALAYPSGTAFAQTGGTWEYDPVVFVPIHENLHRATTTQSPTAEPALRFVNGARDSAGAVSAAQLVTPYSYQITAVDADGNESEASATADITGPSSNNWQAGDYITLRWRAVPGTVEYRVYKGEFGGRPGFIGTAGGLEYRDHNALPALSDGPPVWRDPFPDGDYPAVVCFFEQRLVFASTPGRPQTLWMSRSGDYDNFSASSPLKADDGLELTIASNEVSRMCWMVALRSLVLGSSGMEWEIASAEGAFSARTARVSPQSYRGSAALRALIIDNTIVHITRSGNEVRDFKYDFGSDSYAGSSRTILAEHLFEGHRLLSWAYQPSPDSIIWAVRDDGVLLGMTVQAEHEVFAWHQHHTDGAFCAVCCIPHGVHDDLFAVIRRGAAWRLEKLAARCGDAPMYLDSALTYSGPPVTALSGLEHLEGRTVGVAADGAALAPRVVAGGRIALDGPACRVAVGLPYTADLETMPVEIMGPAGPSVGRKKYINAVNVLFKETVTARVGGDFSRMETYRARSVEPYGQGLAPYSGAHRFILPTHAVNTATVCIRSDSPLPMTVLAIMPEVDAR